MSTSIVNPSIVQQAQSAEENSRRRLTDREIEVLSLIAAGNASKNVAQMLRPKISKRTVDFHLANIYTKLDANNRVQAINNAKAKGYL